MAMIKHTASHQLVRLKELRKQHNDGIEDIATLTLVTPHTVFKWEAGISLPSVNNIFALAERYKVSLSYLLSLSDVKFPLDTYKPAPRIKETREAKGISKYRLAEVIGTQNSVLNAYESENIPSKRISTLVSIAYGLGVSIDYLLGLTRFETWRDCVVENHLFKYFEAGSPVMIRGENETNVKYALLSSDKKSLITINHLAIPTNNPVLENYHIEPLNLDQGMQI